MTFEAVAEYVHKQKTEPKLHSGHQEMLDKIIAE